MSSKYNKKYVKINMKQSIMVTDEPQNSVWWLLLGCQLTGNASYVRNAKYGFLDSCRKAASLSALVKNPLCIRNALAQ